MKEILVVLGAPNSPSGVLSNISKSRLDFCFDLYSPGKHILCTGGWGKHFNVSNEAHAAHAKRYLMKKGIPESDFLDPALSQNTVDDAIKVKGVIPGPEHLHLTVITSDYHVERVKLIFNEILCAYSIKYIGVKATMNPEEMQAIIDHERTAVASILKNGLYYENE